MPELLTSCTTQKSGLYTIYQDVQFIWFDPEHGENPSP
jgi:hypothetical protein